MNPPNGLEMGRPASSWNLSSTRFSAAGRVGSIELLGAQRPAWRSACSIGGIPLPAVPDVSHEAARNHY